MRSEGGECPGLMVVAPAAPHYQGQLHQDQLRFKAFEIATRPFCQHHIYKLQNLSEMCKDLRLSSFCYPCAIKHAVKKCTLSRRNPVGPTVVHGCIFLVGRGCSGLNNSIGRRVFCSCTSAVEALGLYFYNL